MLGASTIAAMAMSQALIQWDDVKFKILFCPCPGGGYSPMQIFVKLYINGENSRLLQIPRDGVGFRKGKNPKKCQISSLFGFSSPIVLKLYLIVTKGVFFVTQFHYR